MATVDVELNEVGLGTVKVDGKTLDNIRSTTIEATAGERTRVIVEYAIAELSFHANDPELMYRVVMPGGPKGEGWSLRQAIQNLMDSLPAD